ncbi:MAG: alpha-amylase family glycosyl hydrolase [Saprospiraceae bacterium]
MFKNLFYLILISFTFIQCDSFNVKSEQPPSWLKSASIYEIMPKNFSLKHNLLGIKEEFPKIRSMFVTAIALTPITPNDQFNASYNPNDPYASLDFMNMDTSLGSKSDLTKFVEDAHQFLFKVILEFDISYTGPNHPWREKKPEYYLSSEQKIDSLYNPKYIQLNYSNNSLRKEILKSLKSWKSKYHIDGIILLNTDALPMDFCEQLSNELKSKEFLLASGSNCPDLVNKNIFDSYLNQDLYTVLKKISKDEAVASDFKSFIELNKNAINKGTTIQFTRNARINELDPSENQLFPYFFKLPAIISIALGGVPLILNGQEEPMFEKIDVKKPTYVTRKYQYNLDFYRSLFIQRKENEAFKSLQNNIPEFITDSEDVLAFERKIENTSIVLMANLKEKEVSYKINRSYNQYLEFFSRALVDFQSGQEYKLGPHQFLLLTNKK